MSDTVTKLKLPEELPIGMPGVVVGLLVGESPEGQPLVRWRDGRRRLQVARTIWMKNPPKWSNCEGLRVILGFENGNERKPILLGFLDTPAMADETLESEGDEPHSATALKPKVLRIESEQELVLECGKAKIALRADGRVVILGGYVLSRSKGVNKIRGGSVQIN